MSTKNGKAYLLLVDDDPDLLRLLTIRLKANGYDVTAVESGQRALASISASRPDRPANGRHGRHGALRRDPGELSGPAGDHPHRPWDHPRRGHRGEARRVR